MEKALSLTCQSTVYPRLPQANEWENIDGLVMAAPNLDTHGFTLHEVHRLRTQTGRNSPVICVIPPKQETTPCSDELLTNPITLNQLNEFIRIALKNTA
ncbi:MAG TPA: hypothetical protein VGG19_07330 [Tepidisphaeraceae bacterium]